MKNARKKILLSFLIFIVSIGFSTSLVSGATTLTVVPYTIDKSNQAGWWSPLATYGAAGASQYAYMAYNSPGSKSSTHKVNVATRDNNGVWTNVLLQNSDATIPEFMNDIGHRQPSVARDGNGNLHVFVSMHNDKWQYFRSNVAGGTPINHSTDMPDQPGLVSYPVIATAPNGDLYLIVRNDVGTSKDGRLYRWNNTTSTWSRIAIFANESGKSVYPDDVQVDAAGNVHILYEWWGATPTQLAGAFRHKLSYIKYNPSTGLFYNANGSSVTLPVSSTTSDVIQPFTGNEHFGSTDLTDSGQIAVQSGKMTLDPGTNTPRVAYRYREITNGFFNVKYAYFNGTSWALSTVYSDSETKAAIDITWDKTDLNRIYFATATGTDRAYMTKLVGSTWTNTSIAPGIPIERLSVNRNEDGIDNLYLVDVTNQKLYYGTTSTSPTSGTMFSDSFESGTSSNWTVVNGTWSVVLDGTYVFKQTDIAGESLANAGSATWTDYSVQADIKIYDNATNAASGILARYVDSNNYYMLRLNQTGKVQLYKKVAGTFTLLNEATQTVTAGSTNTLKLTLTGSSLTGYVNGVAKVSATDTSFTGGKIGARSYKQTMNIDNVIVTN